MSEHPSNAVPSGPFGYAACFDCGAAVRRRLLAHGHECDPERYASHQASKLHWSRHGFEDAVRTWLASPSGRFAQYYARRPVQGGPAARPGEA
jgi:hypothetical protein